jgi:hypothetical protein
VKKTGIVVFVSILLTCSFALGGDMTSLAGDTGDKELDGSLQRLNEAVLKDVRGFAKDLTRYYHVPEATAEWLLEEAGLPPGDAYMAAKVSRITQRPVEDVVREYKKNQGKGWGVIAKNLGIKPGSKEFHELKKDDSGLLNKAKTKDKSKGKKEKSKKKKKK